MEARTIHEYTVKDVLEKAKRIEVAPKGWPIMKNNPRRPARRNPPFKTGRATGAAAKRSTAHAGVVRSSRRKRGVVKNPKLSHRGVRRAVELYSSFHGTEPKWIDEVTIELPPVVALVGKVTAIEYVTPHNRTDVFRHEFTGKSRPNLTVGYNGKQLLLLGGQYYFNDHGIIDGVQP